MFCYIYIFENIQVRVVFFTHTRFFMGRFRAFHKGWYSTVVDDLAETSRFANSLCFSRGWIADSLSLLIGFQLSERFKKSKNFNFILQYFHVKCNIYVTLPQYCGLLVLTYFYSSYHIVTQAVLMLTVNCINAYFI